jgi:AcrR family transcriptional regulator
MSEIVKGRRRYDSSARRRQAEQNRRAILVAARDHFLQHGYAVTTVPAVASTAGVSAETVYKAFGPKHALVRALWEHGLDGRGAVPAPERSDALSSSEPDPVALLRGWSQLAKEVSPEVSPIVLLIRDAAAHDADMAALLDEVDQQRRDRMRHNAERLDSHSWLKPGVDVDQATDVLWTYTSHELYELLVSKSGWDIDDYGDFICNSLISALLDNTPFVRASGD